MRTLRYKTDEHKGREGENIVSNSQGGKPEETLKYREQLRVDGRGGGEGKMGDGH